VTILRLECCNGATIFGKKNFALSYPLDAYLVDFGAAMTLPITPPHCILVNVVGGRNDPPGLQQFFFGGRWGGGVVITSAVHVNSLVLKLDMAMPILYFV